MYCLKVILQRVSRAQVTINQEQTRQIGNGLMVLVGVMEGDEKQQAEFLAQKLVELRVFCDEQDKMNLSLQDIDGEMLIVSNFTLGADCKKGRRPSYTNCARPEKAQALYEYFVQCVRQKGLKNVQTGTFGADMQVSLINDGPVTIILDTKEIGK